MKYQLQMHKNYPSYLTTGMGRTMKADTGTACKLQPYYHNIMHLPRFYDGLICLCLTFFGYTRFTTKHEHYCTVVTLVFHPPLYDRSVSSSSNQYFDNFSFIFGSFYYSILESKMTVDQLCRAYTPG